MYNSLEEIIFTAQNLMGIAKSLSLKERLILELLQKWGFHYIAKDNDNRVYAYNDKPYKCVEGWSTYNTMFPLDCLKDFLVGDFEGISNNLKKPINLSILLSIEE